MRTIIWLIVINLSIFVWLALIIFILESFWVHVWLNWSWLLIYSLIFWFWASILSLLISKFTIEQIEWVRNVSDLTEDEIELIFWDLSYKIFYLKKRLNELNQKYKKDVKLWVYESNEPNAFAYWCGLCWWNSIAFSTWILILMDLDELDWVLWHEYSHIYNWDVVIITILQWFLNTFVIYLSRLLASILTDTEENWYWFWYIVLSFVLEILFWVVVTIILSYISRIREYKADLWSAKYFSNRENMILALEKLLLYSKSPEKIIDKNNEFVATMKINNFWEKLLNLFSTHPSLEDRINKLKNMN